MIEIVNGLSMNDFDFNIMKVISELSTTSWWWYVQNLTDFQQKFTSEIKTKKPYLGKKNVQRNFCMKLDIVVY